MLWQARQLKAVSGAIESARNGRPAVLSVLGEPGMGKTSLLREVARRASGFHVLEGDGRDSGYREPFGLLKDLGVDDVLTPAGTPKDPLIAAQGLRDLVDELSPSGPVLILVDDAHWVDSESLESLYWLIRRARGDRLLVVTGSRPAGPRTSDSWRRLTNQAESEASLTLSGLSLKQARTLILGTEPAADDDAILRLWEHANGNPFHLRSLLDQYGIAELAAMPSLPAPAELAQRVAAELAALPADVVALVHASAVLGYSWQDLPTLTAVGGVQEAAHARQVLVDAGLLVHRAPDMTAALRTSHALMRAAIYQSIPYPRRRELHLRAAGQAGSGIQALEHRVAAADRYDPDLAQELHHAADAAHAAGEFGLARYLFRWSSGMTPDAEIRNRRWLEAVFNAILARDIAVVRQQLPAVRSAQDLARRALILGLMHGVEKRWLDAVTAYTSVGDDVLKQADSMTRYRLLILTAWSMICAGRPADSLAPLLARAAVESAHDPALAGNEIFASGMLRLRSGDEAFLSDVIDSVPARSSATPQQLTYKLAYRGSVHALWGNTALAQADLLEVTARIRSGVADNSDGVYNGLLAFAHWQSGAWNLARVEMGIALECAVGQPHPMNRAIEPVLLAVRGDFEQADRKLRESEEVLGAMPWREAAHLHLISLIARLHAGADPAEQRAALQHLRDVLGDGVLDASGFTGAVWAFHMAIAALWAGERRRAERFIARCEQHPRPPHWMAWVPPWLRGLSAEAAGRPGDALALLGAAISRFSTDLPLYRAHVLADHARVARLRGDRGAAGRSLAGAAQLYRGLGAVPYLEHSASRGAQEEQAAGPAPDIMSVLSDRERDVATLVVAGLSYAQIARDLFITRATVGLHLTRIYAKTGVSSRHELTDLVHRNSAEAEN
jgi:DNA-binding CsgD family transcriptional regulator